MASKSSSMEGSPQREACIGLHHEGVPKQARGQEVKCRPAPKIKKQELIFFLHISAYAELLKSGFC